MISQLLSQGILSIRDATPNDIEGLLALVNGSYRGDGSRQGWTTEADLLDGQRTDRAMLEALLEEEGSSIFLIEAHVDRFHLASESNGLLSRLRTAGIPSQSKTIMVACAHLKKSATDLYFGMLSVDPRWQSLGLGRFCLDYFQNRARTQGARRLWMTVIAQRQELIAYYERRGFHRTGQQHPFPNHDPRYGISKVGDLTLIEMAQEITPNC
jgi:ribosomal protein S18 acetylase RimI-like enzyme